MNFINYLSERPKLTQLGIVLIVFFILMSMTGLYHDLIVERHLFAKSVVKGEIQSSVGFAESMSMILNWQLPPQLVRIPELTFYHPVINTSATYVGVATQDPELRKRLDPDAASERVYNFLHTLAIECQMMARACGKTNVHSLEPEDLAALTMEASACAQVPIAGSQHTVGRPDMTRF